MAESICGYCGDVAMILYSVCFRCGWNGSAGRMATAEEKDAIQARLENAVADLQVFLKKDVTREES